MSICRDNVDIDIDVDKAYVDNSSTVHCHNLQAFQFHRFLSTWKLNCRQCLPVFNISYHTKGKSTRT